MQKNTLLRCDSVTDERVPGEGWVAIVEISEEGVLEVMAVVVAVVVVAAGVLAAVGAAVEAESNLVAAVVVVRDDSKSNALLSAAVMSLIDANVMSVVGRWLLLRRRYWTQSSVCRRR